MNDAHTDEGIMLKPLCHTRGGSLIKNASHLSLDFGPDYSLSYCEWETGIKVAHLALADRNKVSQN